MQRLLSEVPGKEQQEQEQARSTENAEPNEGCTNELGNVRAWGVIVTLLLDFASNEVTHLYM